MASFSLALPKTSASPTVNELIINTYPCPHDSYCSVYPNIYTIHRWICAHFCVPILPGQYLHSSFCTNWIYAHLCAYHKQQSR